MIKKLKIKVKELKSSEYVRNVATLATGTTIAQLISVGTAPILYRIYSKEDYGTLGTYMAIVGVIGVFSTLRYNEAIMLEEDDQDAKKVLWLNRYINIIFTLITIIIVLIGNGFISHYLNNSELKKWLYLIPISIFFSGQNSIFRTWANRKGEYRILTINSILSALVVPFVTILVGLIYQNLLGLFAGLIIGQIVPSFLLYYKLSSKYHLGHEYKPAIVEVKSMAIRHKNFPKYSLMADFLYSFHAQIPVFFLSTFVNAASVGVYNLAVRVLTLPVHLISRSVSEVFRQKAIEEYNALGNCKAVYKKTFKSLFLIGIIPFSIFWFFSPHLFRWVFGEVWEEAGIFAQILTPMVFSSFVVSPLTYLYYIANKQKEDTMTYLVFLVLNIFSFYVFRNDVTILLISYSLIYVIFYLVNLIRSYKFSKGLV